MKEEMIIHDFTKNKKLGKRIFILPIVYTYISTCDRAREMQKIKVRENKKT